MERRPGAIPPQRSRRERRSHPQAEISIAPRQGGGTTNFTNSHGTSFYDRLRLPPEETPHDKRPHFPPSPHLVTVSLNSLLLLVAGVSATATAENWELAVNDKMPAIQRLD